MYEPTSRSNEEDSVVLFRQFAAVPAVRVRLSDALIDRVTAFISATKTHVVSAEDSDLSLFLDVDMSILGKPATRTLEHSESLTNGGVRRASSNS